MRPLPGVRAISYRGELVAVATRSRVYLAPRIEALAPGDPAPRGRDVPVQLRRRCGRGAGTVHELRRGAVRALRARAGRRFRAWRTRAGSGAREEVRRAGRAGGGEAPRSSGVRWPVIAELRGELAIECDRPVLGVLRCLCGGGARVRGIERRPHPNPNRRCRPRNPLIAQSQRPTATRSARSCPGRALQGAVCGGRVRVTMTSGVHSVVPAPPRP
jgi:hypothetical protein